MEYSKEQKIGVADMLISVINELEVPMLLYQIEKDVAKEALTYYVKQLKESKV